MWYSIAITPKCFTYLPYGISFHERFSWMSTLRDISWLFLCVLRRSTIAGPGIWWNIISNQFGTLKFFWLKIARKMTDVFTWQSLFLNTWVWKCILLYFLSIWFIPLELITGKNRWIESMYYFATEAGVKQKLCKVSVVEKNMNFTISKTSGWLLRTSALKSHLLITYLWFYVGLALMNLY